MLVELLQGETGELFGFDLGVPGVRDAVAGIESGGGEQRKAYKLPKILSKRAEKGSSDCAAEGDSGEAL